MRLRRISGILPIIAIWSILVFSVIVKAAEHDIFYNEFDNCSSDGEQVLVAVESEETGSITVYLEDSENKLMKENVKLAVSKVADVEHGEFLLKENYKTEGIDLAQIQNANELELAADKMIKVVTKPDFYMITNDVGVATVSELSTGVYLIYAEDIAGYENITPLMVSVPMFLESEGTMEFDVQIYPKHTLLEEESKPEIPQTGIENHMFRYATMSGICFIMSLVFVLGYYNMKKGENKQNL